jgi:hypothetical protein
MVGFICLCIGGPSFALGALNGIASVDPDHKGRKMKPMKLIPFLVLATCFVGELAHADLFSRFRWRRPDQEFSRRGKEITLGVVRLGDEGRRIDAEEINVRNNRNIECNLTHVKFSAVNKGVKIYKVMVQYRNGQRDSIDLSDRDDRDHRRDPRDRAGLRIRPGSSSEWLDIDDVTDGQQSGRCVDSIQVFGDDIDGWRDRDGRDGRDRDRDHRRPGMDGAVVKVEGFVKSERRRPGFPFPRR